MLCIPASACIFHGTVYGRQVTLKQRGDDIGEKACRALSEALLYRAVCVRVFGGGERVCVTWSSSIPQAQDSRRGQCPSISSPPFMSRRLQKELHDLKTHGTPVGERPTLEMSLFTL